MAGRIIDMSKLKQLLQLKILGQSNRQIAKVLKISRDKTKAYVRIAEREQKKRCLNRMARAME